MPKKAWKQANGRRRITRDVYLGGSCSDVSLAWREEIAIPMLKWVSLWVINIPHISVVLQHTDLHFHTLAISFHRKKGLTYFNPQTSRWQDRLIPIESAAIDSSRVLLFVISDKTRGLASMATVSLHVLIDVFTCHCLNEDFLHERYWFVHVSTLTGSPLHWTGVQCCSLYSVASRDVQDWWWSGWFIF